MCAFYHRLGPLFVNLPFLRSNIHTAPVYGVYITHWIRYSRAGGSYHDFLDRVLLLTRKPLYQRSLMVVLLTFTSLLLIRSEFCIIPITMWQCQPLCIGQKLNVASKIYRSKYLQHALVNISMDGAWVVIFIFFFFLNLLMVTYTREIGFIQACNDILHTCIVYTQVYLHYA